MVAGYAGDRTPALRGVSATVPVGARFALVGPNGAGKSTLLRSVAGLLPLRAGRISVYGLPLGACHHRVAYLPQRSDLDWQFPICVDAFVLAGRYVHLGWLARPGPGDLAVAAAAMAELRITEISRRQIGQLSGGQQQRALLARALTQDADLLLLDEPWNAVDSETRGVMAELFDRLRRSGKTVIVATHDLGPREGDFDGALYLDEGQVVPAPAGASHQRRRVLETAG